MTLVVDASVVVAALIDDGADGDWSLDLLGGGALAAPHLLPAEVASVLRRAAHAGFISGDAAALAHSDMVALPVEYFHYAPFAERVWALRRNISSYDAWYVALAEGLGSGLATLDKKLASAAGPVCRFVLSGSP